MFLYVICLIQQPCLTKVTFKSLLDSTTSSLIILSIYLINLVFGTQEPIDFDQRETSGILNSTTYIIVKMLTKKNALQKLESMIGMEEEDLDRIKSFRQGDSYFKCGNKSFYMHTLLTAKEELDKGNNYRF